MEKFVNNLKRESKVRSAKSSTSTTLDGAVKIRYDHTGDLGCITPVTISDFFEVICQRYELSPALAFKSSLKQDSNAQSTSIQKYWNIISYADYAEKVQHVGKILIHIGMKSHEAVGIFAKNCPEWLFLQFGILKAGGIVFGINPTCSPEEVFHMLSVTKATLCIVDSFEQLKKLGMLCARLPNLRMIFQLNGEKEINFCMKNYFCWNDLLKLTFKNDVIEELQKRECEQFANDCAMIVFTYNSLGKPKAVMLSHDNIIFNVKAIFSSQENLCWTEGRIVSYLPLSHVTAQVFEIFAALLTGACVYFADGNALKGTLVRTLREVKPTMFFGVPWIYEKLEERLSLEQKRKGYLSQFIENTARDAVTLNKFCEVNCSIPVSIKDTFANYIIDNTRRVLGMECCRIFFCGGAPLKANVKQFFGKFNVTVIDIYGLSELAGTATVNRSNVRLESVGKPIDGTKIKIQKRKPENKEGEILFYGRHIFMGYLNEPTETVAVIDKDGWFHTGNLGYLDCEGYLYNTGRKRQIPSTKSADGDIVALVLIEEALKQELPALSNAMVVGENREYLTVLLTLKTETEPSVGVPSDLLHADTRQWLKCLGLKFRKLSAVLNTLKNEKRSINALKIMRSIASIIKRVNNRAVTNTHRIEKFILLRHDFSVVMGELEPSLKIKRKIVLQKYAKKIDEMYS